MWLLISQSKLSLEQGKLQNPAFNLQLFYSFFFLSSEASQLVGILKSWILWAKYAIIFKKIHCSFRQIIY